MSRPESLKGLTFEFVSDVLWSYSKEELYENLSHRTSTDLIGIIERILEDRDSLVHMVEQYSTRMKEDSNKIGILKNELSAVRATNLKEAQANSTRKKINESLAKRLEELDLKYRDEHANLTEQVERLEQQRQDHEVTISKLREQMNDALGRQRQEYELALSKLQEKLQAFTRPESKLLENSILKSEKEACIESVTRQSVTIDRLKREADARNNQIARDGNTIRQLHGQIENQKELIQRLKHQTNERRPQQHSDHPLHHFMVEVSERDVAEVLRKEKTYKGSWMKRGGVGAYMMLARKWDRLESMATEKSYDIFAAINSNLTGDDGTALAEIRDLRRYLMLVESYINSQTCPTTQCPTVEQSAPIEDTTTTQPPSESECLPLEFPKDCWGAKTVIFKRPGCTTSAYAQMKNVLNDILELRNISPNIRHLQEFWNVVNPMIDKWAIEEERALTGHTGTTPPVELWQTANVTKPQIQVLPNGFEVRSIQSVLTSDPGIKPENPDDSNPYLVQERRRHTIIIDDPVKTGEQTYSSAKQDAETFKKQLTDPGELESGKGANVPPPTCTYKFDPVTKTWSHICDVDVSTGDMLYLRSVSSPKEILVTTEGVRERENAKRPIGFTDKQ